jgi:membrane protein involved in colicin uptake
MDMTKKQRNFFLVCGAVLVAFYVIRSVVNFAHQQENFRQQYIRAAQQRAKAEAQAKAKAREKAEKEAAARAAKAAALKAERSAKAHPAAPKAPKPVTYTGVWRGRTAVEGRGLCTLRIEINETEPSRYQGNSRIACVSVAALRSPRERLNKAAAFMDRMNPEAAIISGAMEKGAIALHIDKTIGADSKGCAATSFTLTPFGKNQLAAEWREDTCQGGHVILAKARR